MGLRDVRRVCEVPVPHFNIVCVSDLLGLLRSWQHFRTEHDSGTNANNLQPEKEEKPKTPEKPSSLEKPKIGETSEKEKPKKPVTPKKEKAQSSKGKTAESEIWLEAAKLKKQYLIVMSKAQGVLKQIESNQSWQWAQNESNQGRLSEAIKTIDAKATHLHRAFLTEEPAALKKRYTWEFLSIELQAWLKMKPELDDIQVLVDLLIRRNRA